MIQVKLSVEELRCFSGVEFVTPLLDSEDDSLCYFTLLPLVKCRNVLTCNNGVVYDFASLQKWALHQQTTPLTVIPGLPIYNVEFNVHTFCFFMKRIPVPLVRAIVKVDVLDRLLAITKKTKTRLNKALTRRFKKGRDASTQTEGIASAFVPFKLRLRQKANNQFDT
jgi:hypothetical protein